MRHSIVTWQPETCLHHRVARANAFMVTSNLVLLAAVAISATAASTYSAPALPLAVRSPYFSVWTFGRTTPGSLAKHWSYDPNNGNLARTVILARAGGRVFNILADPLAKGQAENAIQTESLVGATRTEMTYMLGTTNVSVRAVFTTPLLPDDLAALTDPTVYVTLEAINSGERAISVELMFGFTGELLVSAPSPGSGVGPETLNGFTALRSNCTDSDVNVTWSRFDDIPTTSGQNASAGRLGRSKQETLCNKGDRLKANWGWQYLLPAMPPARTIAYKMCVGCGLRNSSAVFAASGTVPNAVDQRGSAPFNLGLDAEPAITASAALGLVVPGASGEARFVWAVDEVLSIDFYGDSLPPYWRRGLGLNDTQVVPRQMLGRALDRWDELDSKTAAFDAALAANATAVGGASLGFMASLAYRQAMGAGAITWHPSRQEPWAFVKEQSTNGDLSTQDIIWPQMPVLALYAPWLLRLELMPHFALCANQTWQPITNGWTTHQLGTWPVAFANNEQEFMPVETTGDMIESVILAETRDPGSMVNAITNGGYWPTVQQWATYLLSQMPTLPAIQKYTNDFRGNQPGWTNLATKGVVGLAGYAWLLGKAPAGALRSDGVTPAALAAAATEASQYFNDHAWVAPTAAMGGHFRSCYSCAAYDADSTFDYKYNLMGVTAMPAEVTAPIAFNQTMIAQDLAFYMTQQKPFGLPFASNSNVTGVPTWQTMFGVSTMDRDTGAVSKEAQWMWDTGARAYSDPSAPAVPMSDMFDAVTLANKGGTNLAEDLGMRARPTVGTLFLPILVNYRAQNKLWPAPMPEATIADTW